MTEARNDRGETPPVTGAAGGDAANRTERGELPEPQRAGTSGSQGQESYHASRQERSQAADPANRPGGPPGRSAGEGRQEASGGGTGSRAHEGTPHEEQRTGTDTRPPVGGPAAAGREPGAAHNPADTTGDGTSRAVAGQDSPLRPDLPAVKEIINAGVAWAENRLQAAIGSNSGDHNDQNKAAAGGEAAPTAPDGSPRLGQPEQIRDVSAQSQETREISTAQQVADGVARYQESIVKEIASIALHTGASGHIVTAIEGVANTIKQAEGEHAGPGPRESAVTDSHEIASHIPFMAQGAQIADNYFAAKAAFDSGNVAEGVHQSLLGTAHAAMAVAEVATAAGVGGAAGAASAAETGLVTAETGVATAEAGVATAETGVATAEAGLATAEDGLAAAERATGAAEEVPPTQRSAGVPGQSEATPSVPQQPPPAATPAEPPPGQSPGSQTQETQTPETPPTGQPTPAPPGDTTPPTLRVPYAPEAPGVRSPASENPAGDPLPGQSPGSQTPETQTSETPPAGQPTPAPPGDTTPPTLRVPYAPEQSGARSPASENQAGHPPPQAATPQSSAEQTAPRGTATPTGPAATELPQPPQGPDTDPAPPPSSGIYPAYPDLAPESVDPPTFPPVEEEPAPSSSSGSTDPTSGVETRSPGAPQRPSERPEISLPDEQPPNSEPDWSLWEEQPGPPPPPDSSR